MVLQGEPGCWSREGWGRLSIQQQFIKEFLGMGGQSCTVTVEAGQSVSENLPLKINLHEGEEREGEREKREEETVSVSME